MPHFDVTIIGAGVGSLCLAALLARAGRKVRVLERAQREGGKAAVRTEGGFVYDEGPSILVLRKVYEDLFRRLDMPMDAHLIFDDLDPASRWAELLGCRGWNDRQSAEKSDSRTTPFRVA